MVRIDWEKRLEEIKKQNESHLEGIAKCEKAKKHVGKQNFLGYDTGTVKEANYQCLTCQWVYSRPMTDEEIRTEMKKSEKYRVK